MRSGNNNENVGGSFIERASEQYIIRGVGLIGSVPDIGKIVMKNRHAGFRSTWRTWRRSERASPPAQGAALKDGQGEVVGGIVMMLKGENSLDVVRPSRGAGRGDQRRQRASRTASSWSPITTVSEIVTQSIHTILRTLAEGAILVMVVLTCCCGTSRGAFVVIMALPLAMLFTFIVMKQAGIDANLMSLGGLAISIGMIIDATIIQVENVQRHLAQMNGTASGWRPSCGP